PAPGPRRMATLWEMERPDLRWRDFKLPYGSAKIEIGEGRRVGESFKIADYLEASGQCLTCGDQADVVGLTTKCRDWHEVCQCGERYDQLKAKSCRRRKHAKEEK